MVNQDGYYDLIAIANHCDMHGLSHRYASGGNVLEIVCSRDAVLYFCNDLEGEDIAAGFLDSPWHYHSLKLDLEVEPGGYLEYSPLDLLDAIVEGEVLLVTQVKDGKVSDRWLCHKNNPLDMRYIDPDEELWVSRLV